MFIYSVLSSTVHQIVSSSRTWQLEHEPPYDGHLLWVS